MTDARVPDQWLGKPEFDAMSDETWRVFIGALQWSNRNGTDGKIPNRYLKFLHPDGEKPKAIEWLIKNGFCAAQADSLQFLEWEKRLEQSPAEKVQGYKEANRIRQQNYRDSLKDPKPKPPPKPPKPESQSPVEPIKVTRDVTRDVGQDTIGQDKTGLIGEAVSEDLETFCQGCGLELDWSMKKDFAFCPECKEKQDGS
jgi:hypothetical protein